jgi:hypothetical protein
MRRLLLLLTCLVPLAGCDAGGGLAPLPTPHATASFPAGSVVNVINLDVLDDLPLRAAELVAPDGTTTPASWLNVNGRLQSNGGQVAMTTPWRSTAGFGDAPPAALPNGTMTDAAYASHSELLLMSADATITLPDPVAYGRDWQNYRIRLTFGAPGAPEIRDIPAPQPPPQSPGTANPPNMPAP